MEEFIALFGTLTQAWRWPWEKPYSKLISCVEYIAPTCLDRNESVRNGQNLRYLRALITLSCLSERFKQAVVLQGPAGFDLMKKYYDSKIIVWHLTLTKKKQKKKTEKPDSFLLPQDKCPSVNRPKKQIVIAFESWESQSEIQKYFGKLSNVHFLSVFLKEDKSAIVCLDSSGRISIGVE